MKKAYGVLPALAGLVCSVSPMMIATASFAQEGSEPRCEELLDWALGADGIGLPTNGAKVTSAVRTAEVPPNPDSPEQLRAIPPHCVISGEILPVDPAAPKILFNVNLPLAWNGDALMSGGGGMGGSVNTSPGRKGYGRIDPVPINAPYPLELGYATFGSDGGHQGGDPAFTRSDEAMRNWAGEGNKKTRDVAVALISDAYGQAPDHLYFTGESAGGREAVWMAQHYPEDFDGIAATSPVLAWYYAHLADVNNRDHLVNGWLDEAAIKLVADHTRATCDAADGLEDGVIAKYLECPNNVAELICEPGQEDGCLTDAQIASVSALRNPWSLPFPLAFGQTRYAGLGVTGDEDGARDQWNVYPVGTVQPSRVLPPGRGFEDGVGSTVNFGAFLIRHTIVGDDTFDPLYFDASPYRERIQYLSELFDAVDPDLSAFHAAGGKLLILQPSADNALGTPMVADYYNSVRRELGDAVADETIRLYVGPGGGHNVTGVTQTDLFGALVSWVEEDEAPPSSLTSYLVNDDLEVERSMPSCIYPAYAKYDGTGDENDAASFDCTDRADPLGFTSGR